MRILAALLSLIALTGCSDPPRYTVGGSNAAVVMVDNTTGESWFMERGPDGLWAWSPMGRRLEPVGARHVDPSQP